MARVIFTQILCCCVFIFLNCLRTSCTATQRGSNKAGKINYGTIKGDIVLGGLFRVHRNGGAIQCENETVEVELGIQRVEAMVYAIQKINEDPRLLPNVTLGAEIRDTCSIGSVALEESLKFILDSRSLRATSRAAGDYCTGNVSKDVVGVVGASRSSFSVEVAKLLRLFKVPQVSYASTSAELSDHEKYSFFARTVPPDTLQALAMLHIIKKFEWKSVFTVNSVGSYGEKGIEQFKKRAKDSVCVVLSKQVTDKYVAEDYDEIIEEFSGQSTTRVIVLFMKDNHIKKLLQSANRKKFEKRVWVASDEWGIRPDIVENLGTFWKTSHAITISLPSSPLKEFRDYFKGLTGREKRDANPWFGQYWKQQNCSSTCNVTKFNDKLPYVIDAVYAFAYALHEMYEENCPMMKGLCEKMIPVNGTELRDRLLNISFHNEKTSHTVAFDQNGDSKGKYNISYYHNNRYISLGEWHDKFNLTRNIRNSFGVTSTCDSKCHPWSRILPGENAPCCKRCIDCLHKERQYIKPEDNMTCVDCMEHQRPNNNYDGCVDLELRYIPKEWTIIVSILAGLGVLFTLIVIGLFCHNINTPVVKASGRDLIFPLLAGVLLNYIMTFFLVGEPHVVTCAIQRFGFGCSSSLCYASILLKTNRIARIFANQSPKSVSFTKPHTQLVILVLLVAIEVSVVSIGLVIKPPHIIKVLPTSHDILVKCNISKYDYAISSPYNLLLVILCTIFTFRTRKTPSSFNEAKYLGFVMYTTCIIWIAFLPVFYGTAENYQPIALSLNTTLIASTILVCLFGPKIYIMVFRPSRNVQTPLTMTTSRSTADLSTITGALPPKPAVFEESNSNEPASSQDQVFQNSDIGNESSTNISEAIPQHESHNDQDTDVQGTKEN